MVATTSFFSAYALPSMKPHAQGKRSLPVQMRLFRVESNEQPPDEPITDPATLSPPYSANTPLYNSFTSMKQYAEPLEEPRSPRFAFPPTPRSLRPSTLNAPTSTIESVVSPMSDKPMTSPNPELRSPRTPASETSEGWSAVGRATLSGRSGRVIERLQSELDQTKREKKALQLNYDELSASHEHAQGELLSLRTSADTSVSIAATNEAQLRRRDRKINDLKEDLQLERERREQAELAQAKTLAESNQRIERTARALDRSMEEAKHYQTQYDVITKSFQQLQTEYHGKMEKLTLTSSSMLETVHSDQQKISTYEQNAENLRAGYERMRRVSLQTAKQHEEYKAACEKRTTELMQELEAYRSKMAEMEALVAETVGAMKHVMNVRTTFKGSFTDATE